MRSCAKRLAPASFCFLQHSTARLSLQRRALCSVVCNSVSRSRVSHRNGFRHPLAISRRSFWLPPPALLRVIARPLAVLLVTFLGGVAMQFVSSQQKDVKMIETAEKQIAEAKLLRTARILRVTGVSLIIATVLYTTRGHNPLYATVFGSDEAHLELARQSSAKPLSVYWDSRTALDSMKARLKKMDSELALFTTLSKAPEAIDRANAVRQNGHSNAIAIALARARHWNTSAQTTKVEQCVALIEMWQAKGGTLKDDELQRLIRSVYAKECRKHMAVAQNAAANGDVPKVNASLVTIKKLIAKHGLDASVLTKERILSLRKTAHKTQRSKLLREADSLRKQGAFARAEQLERSADSLGVL